MESGSEGLLADLHYPAVFQTDKVEAGLLCVAADFCSVHVVNHGTGGSNDFIVLHVTPSSSLAMEPTPDGS